MKTNLPRRLWIVVLALGIGTIIIAGRLFVFMVLSNDLDAPPDEVTVIDRPERGIIYDRNGAILAANGKDYQISASPNLITDPEQLATELTSILQIPRLDILNAIDKNVPIENGNQNEDPKKEKLFVMLAGRVSSETAGQVRELEASGIQIDPLPRRFYPQGDLLCHTLGYVDFDNEGGMGLEGYYQSELAGQAASATINISPLTVQKGVIARDGSDLVLTIDRTVQHLVEEHLKRALQQHGAVSGTIIVMDPRTGAVLALANEPCYSPHDFYLQENEERLPNPAVNQQFEPGSVMKLVTMASALDSGTVTPTSTYYDAGYIEYGGHITKNWDLSAPGTTDMETLLARSLNDGAATIAIWMGEKVYYDYLQQFGFGRPTGIDLLAEASGIMPLPGDENWTDAFLATNAYGQSLAVTSLQMTAAVAALANDGYLMRPYIVEEIHNENGVFIHQPDVMSRPVSPETAHQLTAMAVAAVAREVPLAQVDGYTIAGKTGTAQIPGPGGYLEDAVIGSFIGWLPADNPEIVVFVKIDRPTSAQWGSQTAAPVFAGLVDDLVVLLDIPPDNIRLRADVMAARQGN